MDGIDGMDDGELTIKRNVIVTVAHEERGGGQLVEC